MSQDQLKLRSIYNLAFIIDKVLTGKPIEDVSLCFEPFTLNGFKDRMKQKTMTSALAEKSSEETREKQESSSLGEQNHNQGIHKLHR